MKVSELYTKVLQMLEDGKCESPTFDAMCLLEDIGEIGRGNVLLKKDHIIAQELTERILEAAKQRAAGTPLQYLLGTWDFLNLTLKVGEGVLIPRPETELLCQTVAESLSAQKRTRPAVVWDLCAGTGCVGLGIASLYPHCEVLAVELSPQAISYLAENVNAYPDFSVKVQQANIVTDFSHPAFNGTPDVIVSNPPYIPRGELADLQREVQCEPILALDGGEDGYAFYHAIAKHWACKLSQNGLLAVEVGIGQAEFVAAMFRATGFFANIKIVQDYANIDRIVLAHKREDCSR